MLSSVGLEVMNSTNPELNWKTVTKGRRSRKSIAARSLNGFGKVGNFTSPKRVGDFSVSESDKAGEVVRGQSASGKSESVPIKKRRHLLQCPSPHPWTPSLHRQGSASPQTSSPSFEDQEQLLYLSHQKFSNEQLHEIDGSAKFRFGKGSHKLCLGDQKKHEYSDAGDFSGIELLAAAASMDDAGNDNVNKRDIVAKDSLIPTKLDTSDSSIQSKVGSKTNEPEKCSSNTVVHGVNSNCSPVLSNSVTASQSLGGSAEDRTMPKVSRQHWDLNTPMDAWEEPYGDSFAGNTSKDVDNGMKDEYSKLKIEETKLSTVSPDTICGVRLSLEKHLEEPPSVPSNAAEKTSYQAAERDGSERNMTEVSNCDAPMDACDRVMTAYSVLDCSPLTKPSFSSGMLMPEEKINLMSGPVAKISVEDISSNMREFDRVTSSGRIPTRTQDITALVTPIPQSPISIQCKDNRDFQKNSELRGTFIQDGRLLVTADSKTQIDGKFISGSKLTDFQGHVGMTALVAKHEDKNLANESTRTLTEDSSKSYSPPIASVLKIGSSIDGPPDSDTFQNNHVKIGDGVDLTGFQEGYDSPYEDGELRGSFFNSWEDNEMENECVDYESDGRNADDGSDAADYRGSEIVEGGSEGSRGTLRRNSLLKGFPAGKDKVELAKHSIKDDSDNNEIAGKGSKAGSGTTVEQSMEMLTDENDGGIKRSQLTDQRNSAGVKLTRIDEYESKTARGNNHSRIERRSCMDAADGNYGFFIQQCRSRRGGSYSRSGRDISPDKYICRYSPASYVETHGVQQFGTSCGSKRRYTSSYQEAECRPQTRPRSKYGDSGLDFHAPRQNANYFRKGLHRPFMRRSPVESDGYFGPNRRMPPARGVGNYRGRGHYSQHGGRGSRDFADEFDPLRGDVGPPIRMPCYYSKRERSFSQSSGRSSHLMPLLPRRRSRSRSRTRSPRAWNLTRERIFSNNRRNTNSRSPDFRLQAGMERVRMPFPKPAFQSDYGEREYISPQHNRRWVDDRSNFVDNHNMRRRRSPPVKVFRHGERFDDVQSSGRLKSDEYLRPPMMRSGRFSFTGKGGKECKLDDRRRDDDNEVMQLAPYCDDGGGDMSRHPGNAVNDFETSDLINLNNNEDDVPRDVNQSQEDAEDKRGLET